MLIGQQQTPDFQDLCITECPFYTEDEEWIGKKLLQKDKIQYFKQWENIKILREYYY